MRPPDRRAAGPCGRPFMMRAGWQRRTTVGLVSPSAAKASHGPSPVPFPRPRPATGAKPASAPQQPSGPVRANDAT
jgi:hypothetical protein